MSSIGSSSPEKKGSEELPRALSEEEFLDPNFDPKLLKNIVKEGIIVSAGAAAILLQVASPGVAAGVNEHSNFAYRVQDRLRTTMTFGTSFGRSVSSFVVHSHRTDSAKQSTAWLLALPRSGKRS